MQQQLRRLVPDMMPSPIWTKQLALVTNHLPDHCRYDSEMNRRHWRSPDLESALMTLLEELESEMQFK